jgi:hypothetical protein
VTLNGMALQAYYPSAVANPAIIGFRPRFARSRCRSEVDPGNWTGS